MSHSQNTRILAHLRRGHTLTALQALSRFGSLRLAARIRDLKRDGYKIDSQMVRRNGKRVAAYELARR